MLGLGPHELLLLFLIVLLLFGAKRIPEIARGLGRSLRDFKKGLDGADEEHASAAPPPPTGAPDSSTTAADREAGERVASPGPDNARRP